MKEAPAPDEVANEQHRRNKEHVTVKQVFEMLGAPAKRKTCHGIMGLIEETEEHQGRLRTIPSRRDITGQKAEHYEIAHLARRSTLRGPLARTMWSQLPQDTLDEEKAADAKLSAIAETTVNRQAAQVEPDEDEDEARSAVGVKAQGSRQGGRNQGGRKR